MKPASFAVALNCGIGSSSLNAEVNAFDRLQIVRALNSSYCGLFLPICGKITVDHGVADRLNAASPYRRSHSVYLVPAQSLHGQHRCCTQELLADEPLRRWKQTGLYVYGSQEACELRRSFELGYWLEFLERRGEGVRQAPEGARFELRVSRPEVEIVDLPGQVLRSI